MSGAWWMHPGVRPTAARPLSASGRVPAGGSYAVGAGHSAFVRQKLETEAPQWPLHHGRGPTSGLAVSAADCRMGGLGSPGSVSTAAGSDSIWSSSDPSSSRSSRDSPRRAPSPGPAGSYAIGSSTHRPPVLGTYGRSSPTASAATPPIASSAHRHCWNSGGGSPALHGSAAGIRPRSIGALVEKAGRGQWAPERVDSRNFSSGGSCSSSTRATGPPTWGADWRRADRSGPVRVPPPANGALGSALAHSYAGAVSSAGGSPASTGLRPRTPLHTSQPPTPNHDVPGSIAFQSGERIGISQADCSLGGERGFGVERRDDFGVGVCDRYQDRYGVGSPVGVEGDVHAHGPAARSYVGGGSAIRRGPSPHHSARPLADTTMYGSYHHATPVTDRLLRSSYRSDRPLSGGAWRSSHQATTPPMEESRSFAHQHARHVVDEPWRPPQPTSGQLPDAAWRSPLQPTGAAPDELRRSQHHFSRPATDEVDCKAVRNYAGAASPAVGDVAPQPNVNLNSGLAAGTGNFADHKFAGAHLPVAMDDADVELQEAIQLSLRQAAEDARRREEQEAMRIAAEAAVAAEVACRSCASRQSPTAESSSSEASDDGALYDIANQHRLRKAPQDSTHGEASQPVRRIARLLSGSTVNEVHREPAIEPGVHDVHRNTTSPVQPVHSGQAQPRTDEPTRRETVNTAPSLSRNVSLARLFAPFKWLTDACISFVYEGLVEHGGGNCGSETAKLPDSILLMEPALAFWLSAETHSEFIEETLRELKLDERKIVLCPINDSCDVTRADAGTHWGLLVWDRRGVASNMKSGRTSTDTCGSFFYYDSDVCARIVPSSAKDLARCLAGASPRISIRPCAKQTNTFDCGMYVIVFSEIIVSAFLSEDAAARNRAGAPLLSPPWEAGLLAVSPRKVTESRAFYHRVLSGAAAAGA